MTLKQKILLLGAIPVLLMALVVNLSNYLVARSDLESELVVARDKAVKERKALLSSYLMLAKTAIEKEYAAPDSPEARARVKELLRPLRYGSDGYFFVYDFQPFIGSTLCGYFYGKMCKPAVFCRTMPVFYFRRNIHNITGV